MPRRSTVDSVPTSFWRKVPKRRQHTRKVEGGGIAPPGCWGDLKKTPKRLFPSHGRLDISIWIALQLYWITLLEFAGRFQRYLTKQAPLNSHLCLFFSRAHVPCKGWAAGSPVHTRGHWGAHHHGGVGCEEEKRIKRCTNRPENIVSTAHVTNSCVRFEITLRICEPSQYTDSAYRTHTQVPVWEDGKGWENLHPASSHLWEKWKLGEPSTVRVCESAVWCPVQWKWREITAQQVSPSSRSSTTMAVPTPTIASSNPNSRAQTKLQ